ncbi:LPXTG cell wall anchor domain-containing protein [Microbacterium sp. LRZ72]|nr:LPXTG cell wall anchor domain-containing protein [Microbacterium sp. LRZ72]
MQIGSGTVDAAGNITVTIPADAALGTHRLAVYTEDGELLGWTSIQIVAEGSLASTGSEQSGSALALALMLLLAGAGVIAVRRRVRAG